jgi:hypothetical protein
MGLEKLADNRTNNVRKKQIKRINCFAKKKIFKCISLKQIVRKNKSDILQNNF